MALVWLPRWSHLDDPFGVFLMNFNLSVMETTLIQAVIKGRKMQDVAKEMGISPSKLSLQLQSEMNQVANHRLNQHLSEVLSVRNAFAIRRNAREWSMACANVSSTNSNSTELKPIEHIFTVGSVSEAFDIGLTHHSISKKDAMILVYNATINAFKDEI